MVLKAHLSALIQIQGHLRGNRECPHWRHQADMDRDLPAILRQWHDVVMHFWWDTPEEPYSLIDCTGMGPSAWRLATIMQSDIHTYVRRLSSKRSAGTQRGSRSSVPRGAGGHGALHTRVASPPRRGDSHGPSPYPQLGHGPLFQVVSDTRGRG